MNRLAKKILIAAVGGAFIALAAVSSYAAGLGRLTVNSALGQPLIAEIELVSLQPGELDAITAKAASQDAYRDAKVEFSPLLHSLRFAVDKNIDGKSVVKITSTMPINEPFLDMLVEISWPSGRLLREYPILLDPPGYNEARTMPPQTVSLAAKPLAPAPVSPPATAPVSVVPPAPKQSAADTYGPVKKGDTLNKIASEMKPDSVSLEQMLIALYRNNRAAFIGNNMNRLKAGQILRVPAASEAMRISKIEAHKEIKVHVASWKEYREKLAGDVLTEPSKPVATNQATGKIMPATPDLPLPVVASNKDVLKLSKSDAAASSKTGGASAKGGNALQEQLTAMEEEAIARNNQLKEANSRVAVLEKQIAEMRKLMELKATAPAADGKIAAPETPKTESAEVTKAAPATPSEKGANIKAEEVKPVDAKAEVSKVAKAKVAPAKNVFSHFVEDNWPILVAGGGAGVLAIGGLFMFLRRRKQAQKDSGLGQILSMTSSDLEPGTITGEGKGEGELVDAGNNSFLSDFDKAASAGAIDTDEVDPVAEAEVYIAYGRDAQAEEILKEAMSRNKNRHEVAVKLLEIYHGRKNVTAFDAVARKLKAAIGDTHPLWAKVAVMGTQIDPGNALYGGSSGASVHDAAATAKGDSASEKSGEALSSPDFDLALLDAAPGAGAPSGIALPHAASASSSLGFNLDTSSTTEHSQSSNATQKAPTATPSSTAGLDFDLDFDIPAVPPPPARVEEAGSFNLSNLSLTGTDSDASTQSAAQERADEATNASASIQAKTPVLNLSDISLQLDSPPISSGSSDDINTATKLELAKAYIEIGDKEGAKEILAEVAREGSTAQQEEAKKIMADL